MSLLPLEALLLAMLATGCDCGSERDPESAELAPSLLLVTIDTRRADHLDHQLTPNIQAVAEQGWRFTNAWSPMGLTSPAHATIFTARFPWQHDMRGNNHHGYELPWQANTLAEQARTSGWRTAAWVSAYPAGPAGGLDQGFQLFDAPEASERPGDVADQLRHLRGVLRVRHVASAWLSARRACLTTLEAVSPP